VRGKKGKKKGQVKGKKETLAILEALLKWEEKKEKGRGHKPKFFQATIEERKKKRKREKREKTT